MNQTRGHAGHSHGHGHGHHHHDTTYLVSRNKADPGVRITRIGLFVNVGMAVGKGAGGFVFNSQALIADAIHSLADLVSDFMTLATVTWSAKRPSPRFPSGYGKVESLGSLGVSGLLLVGGVLMGWAAVGALLQQFAPEVAHTLAEWGVLGGHGHGHSHSHSHTDLGPNIHAAWLAGGSILVKEWLYRATLKIAKERKSTVLASNAYHHRVDSLTSFVALLTIAGSNVLSNAAWLDPVGGLAISVMVVQAGWGNTRQALLELADVGVDDDMTSSVRKHATQALSASDVSGATQEVEVRTVSGVKSGQNYLMHLELAVPSTWTVEQTRRIEDLVREHVARRVRGVKRLRFRIVTREEAREGTVSEEFVNEGVSAQETPEPDEEEHEQDGHGHEHKHEHERSHGKGNGVHPRK